MIYYCSLENVYNYDRIMEKSKQMPIERYKNYTNYVNKDDKIKNVIAYLLIKKYLINHGIESNVEFSYNDNGKPYFNNTNLKFSISHSIDTVVVAFDDEDIGVDIEKIDYFNSELINYIFSKNDKQIYSNKLNSTEFVCRVWTKKEAFVKAIGDGLLDSFANLTFDYKDDTNIYKGFIIKTYKISDSFLSVCSKKEKHEFEKINLSDLEYI